MLTTMLTAENIMTTGNNLQPGESVTLNLSVSLKPIRRTFNVIVSRIEALQFDIEMEAFDMPSAARWATLKARQDVLDDYAVKHLGSIVLGD